MYVALAELFRDWGGLKCSRTGARLFTKATEKKAEGVLETVARGWVSDPPETLLYVIMQVDNEGLPVYRCLRGTNSVEGGVHMVLMQTFGPLSASPELSDCLLADNRHRHNSDVSDSPHLKC